jgi:hypothetical protein
MEESQLYMFIYRDYMFVDIDVIENKEMLLEKAVVEHRLPEAYDASKITTRVFNGTRNDIAQAKDEWEQQQRQQLKEELINREESPKPKMVTDLSSYSIPAYTSNTVSIEDLRKIFQPQVDSTAPVWEYTLTERNKDGFPQSEIHRHDALIYSTVDKNLEILWIQLRDCRYEGMLNFKPCFKR